MATSNPLLILGFRAEDAIEQYRFVREGTTGDQVRAGVANSNFGVCCQPGNVVAGERVDVGLVGAFEVEAAAAIGMGAKVTSDATGKAVVAAAGVGVEVAGIALQAAASGDIFTVLLDRGIARA